MRSQKEVIRAYLRALKDLPGGRGKNEEYRKYIRGSIEEVYGNQPEDGEQAVLELLGEPEAVRESYVQSLSPEELELGRRKKRSRRTRKLAVLIPVCVIVLVLVWFCVQRYYFAPATVVIARPIDREAERYIECPRLVHPDAPLGVSPKMAYWDRLFMDNTAQIYQELWDKYPEGCHITCEVRVQRGKTLVIWTGTGVTAEGLTEEVGRRYSFPLAFRVKEPEELTGEAAERVREAEAELLQRYRLEQVQQTRVAVMFSDGAGKALRPKDGWYDLGKASSVTVAWAGLTPDTVRLFYTPSGTDTAEETRLLGVRVPEDGGGEVSFAITELDMPASLLGHIQAELDYGTAKAVSEIYKAVYEPEG